jgi:hypothetical protein
MHFRHVLTPFELLCCIDREDTVSLNHTVVEVSYMERSCGLHTSQLTTILGAHNLLHLESTYEISGQTVASVLS